MTQIIIVTLFGGGLQAPAEYLSKVINSFAKREDKNTIGFYKR